MSRRKSKGGPISGPEEEDKASERMVVLRGVNKSFTMGEKTVHALKDVNLTLPTGRMATIQGPSGSGKTTLLNIVGAMDVPTSGSVKVAGHELGRLTDDALTTFRKHNVGFVFQFFNLIPSLNALENVLVPVMFDGEPPVDRGMELLDLVGMVDRWDHRPGELSGGERQRLAVARALINDPPLLLADEPTGNLDNETGRGVLRLLEGLVGEGRTVILVTHDDEVAARGQVRFTLRDGVLREWKEGDR
jgi:putative ABC transport system ATP-binding protein